MAVKECHRSVQSAAWPDSPPLRVFVASQIYKHTLPASGQATNCTQPILLQPSAVTLVFPPARWSVRYSLFFSALLLSRLTFGQLKALTRHVPATCSLHSFTTSSFRSFLSAFVIRSFVQLTSFGTAQQACSWTRLLILLLVLVHSHPCFPHRARPASRYHSIKPLRK